MRPYSPGGEEEPGQNKIVTYIVYHCTCSVQVTFQRIIKDNQLYSISPQKLKNKMLIIQICSLIPVVLKFIAGQKNQGH